MGCLLYTAREEQERSILKVTEFVTVAELATMRNVSATEVITACMNLGPVSYTHLTPAASSAKAA